jgi:Ferritin-like
MRCPQRNARLPQEEMLHLMLVSNLLNSIGTTPKLSGEYVPRHPGFIPHHAAGGPSLQLQTSYVQFADDRDMVFFWKDFGFVFNEGSETEPRFVEVERILPRPK